MAINHTTTITCDDTNHNDEELDCGYVSATCLADVREQAHNRDWTTNGKSGSAERWHCPESEFPWCVEACGRYAVTGSVRCRNC